MFPIPVSLGLRLNNNGMKYKKVNKMCSPHYSDAFGRAFEKSILGAFGKTFGESFWENANAFELKVFFKIQIVFGKFYCKSLL